jgi:hypothetical protein
VIPAFSRLRAAWAKKGEEGRERRRRKRKRRRMGRR